MSENNLSDPPIYSDVLTRVGILQGIGHSFQGRQSGVGPPSDDDEGDGDDSLDAYGFESIPWGVDVGAGYGTAYNTPYTGTGADPYIAAQANREAVRNSAQSALDGAVAELATLRAQLAERQAAYQAAAVAENDSDLTVERKYRKYATLQRRAAAMPPTATAGDVSDALDELMAAYTADDATYSALYDARAAYHTSQSDAAGKLNEISGDYQALKNAQASVDIYSFAHGLPEGYGVGNLSVGVANNNYGRSVGGQYRAVITISDKAHQALLAAGLAIRLDWLESTITTTSLPPGSAIAISSSAMSEDVDPGGAVQAPDERWVIYGEIHNVSSPGYPPAMSNTVVKFGFAEPPTMTAIYQTVRSEVQRRGWSENQTPMHQDAPKRYLTLTASDGDGIPAGVHYTGTQTVNPPTDTLAITPEDYQSLYSARLQIAPQSFGAVTDAALLQSNVERTLKKPAGFRVILTDLEGDSVTMAEAGLGDWPPDPDVHYGSTGPFAPAINDASKDGDYCLLQKARYKFSYSAPSSGGVPPVYFSPTYRWKIIRRNLDTGVETEEMHSTSVTFPIVTYGGSGAPIYSYTYTDEAWTEIAVGERESAELVILPGEIEYPQAFTGDATVALVAAAG